MPGETIDYLGQLARNSARFAEVLAAAADGAPVPTCPGWTSEDLLWHLAEVQWFWGTIVRDELTGAEAEALKPVRPVGRLAGRGFFERASAELRAVLAATPPYAPAWTWSTEQTAGFVRRRQAHEALIHRVDAELVAGADRMPIDPRFGADGVDEVLRIMYGDHPAWGRFDPEPAQTVLLRTTDTGDAWLITLGRFAGTDPGDGVHYDEPALAVAAEASSPAAMLTGRAEDLDLWLWHRPPAQPLTRTGDPAVLAAFEASFAQG